MDNFEDHILNIRDLKPGMSSVNIRVTVSEILKHKQVITSKGVEHEILMQKWQMKLARLRWFCGMRRFFPQVEDVLRIGNGFMTSFKGE